MDGQALARDPVYHYADATFLGHWWIHLLVCAFCVGLILLGLIFIDHVGRSWQAHYPALPQGVNHVEAPAGPIFIRIHRSIVGPTLIVVAGLLLMLGSYLTHPSRASINREGMIDLFGGKDLGFHNSADLHQLQADIQAGRAKVGLDGRIERLVDSSAKPKED